MDTPKIFESEYRFCMILWENEPIGSTALVKLCKERLGWSKPTTYTVIRRLSERGVVKNENSVVSSVISKEQAQIAQIDEIMETRFDGDVPAFLAAFTNHKKLSEKQIAEIMEIINSAEEE